MNRIKPKLWIGPVLICLPLLVTILVQRTVRREAEERRQLQAQILAKQVSAAKIPLLPDGVYIGLEPMPNIDPQHPDAKWYHLNTLSLLGGNATLDKEPVWDLKGKRSYSASDGGFYTYKGRVEQQSKGMVLQLTLTESDYVYFAPGSDPNRTLTVKMNKDGSLTVKGVVYRVRQKKN